MSKNYSKTFTSLKTVTHDTSFLDAQKITVNTDSTDLTQRKNVVEYIDEKDENIYNRIDSLNVLSDDEKLIFNDVIKEHIIKYTEYNTNTFDLAIEGDNVYTSSFRYGSNHLPKGVIKSIQLYGRDATSQTHASKDEGCYLIANVYKTDGTLVRSYTSTNKVNVIEKLPEETERQLNVWDFEGIESLEDDEILKIIPSPDGINQVENYYIGVRVDPTHTHDDCQEGGDWDFVNNPIAQGTKCCVLAKFVGNFYKRVTNETELKSYEKDFLKSIYTKTTGTLFDNNINNETLGQASVKGFVLARPYISNITFNEVRWSAIGTNSSTCYMKLTLRDYNGVPIKSFFSNNTQDFNSQGEKVYKFNEEITVTDEVGSILFETSDDGTSVSTSSQFRVRVIGNAAKNDTNGSECTNANFVIHAIFWGVTSTEVGGDILTTTAANEQFVSKTGGSELFAAKKYEEIIDSLINTSLGKVAEGATGEGEVNAIHYSASVIPHEQAIEQIILPALNSCSSPYYLAVWTIDGSDRKTYRGLSDNSITWTEGTNAIWNFVKNPITVPTGHRLEIYITDGEGSVGNREANVPAHHIKVRTDYSGSGTIRYDADWHTGRNITTEFRTIGIIDEHIGDETHLTETQREVLNEVIAGGFVTKDEFSELLEQSSQKQQYYDTWTNLKDGDIVDKAGVYSFQLDKNDFTTGRIDRIEIPYIAGQNTTGYLCVQFFNSSNSAIATYYSINKQKQDKTGENTRGICEFEFSTFETPAEYSYVRFSMVANNWTVPTGNSGISFRIMPIKRNNTFTWNTNTNTKINNTGNGWTILLSVLTRNYAKNTGITVRSYDWTPDVFCPITVTLSTAGTAFVAPTNGWIISKSAQTTSGANSLTLNGIEIGKSSTTAQADVQILMRQGEYITATTAYNLIFYPCKSEQFDYRIDSNNCDIWKGAVVYDEYGQPSVKDLYIPDASAWKTEVGSAVNGKIDNINGEEARDASGNVLFNIQTRFIEVANQTFSGTSMKTISNTTWDVLRSAEAMFASSSLTGWNNNLPALQQGYCMFYNSGSFTSFTGSLSALGDGMRMFGSCSALTDVNITGTMTNLWRGNEMFKGCSLSYASLTNVLNAIPQTTASGRFIEITVADSVADDMVDDERFTDAEIPPFSGSTYFSFTHNGWEVRLTSQTGFVVSSLAPTPYDVTVANGYIPDASAWRGDMGETIVRNITRVSNEIAYNDNN